MKYLTRILPLLSIIFLLNGCEADLKTEKQGDKMDAFFQSNNNTSLSVLSKHGLNAGFVRTQGTELENNFPVLPNPVLNMFVYPHLTKFGNPVPGYTTNFKLYEVDRYALPNEAL
ncbi:hypothetical protein [uncultured Gammaproteobacteria bacterium]|nr:hypothetical protein [uncultured Gammaproteobacteria bacterium]